MNGGAGQTLRSAETKQQTMEGKQMKKKEDNSFQLLFTALVLVVIAVGGTLAWFASNTTASVDQIPASITSPSDNNTFDDVPLYYLEGSQYVQYGDGSVIFVPGMKKLFRVQVDPTRSQAILLVLDDDTAPTLGNAMKISFHDQWNSNWSTEANFPTPTATLNSLIDPNGQYGLTVTHNIPSGNGSQYIYFVVYMDPNAGNSYQGLDFRFHVGVVN